MIINSQLSDKPTKISELINDSGFITSYTETDPTVPSWAKASTKPSYTASEVNAAPSIHTHTMSQITDLEISGGGGADILTATSSSSVLGTTSTGSGYASFTSSYSSLPGVSINGTSFTVPDGYTKACIIAHADLMQETSWREPSIQIRKNGSNIRSYTMVNCGISARIPTTLSATCTVVSGDTISLYGSAPYGNDGRTAIYFTGITILLFK